VIEPNKIYLGDCLELMPQIASASIDMILCDLPYGTTACKWDTIIPFDKLWEQYERIIKENGAIVLTGSQPFTSALIMSNAKLFKYEWIWDKKAANNFLNCNKEPLKRHENILVFYKKTPTYNPQKTKGEPYITTAKSAAVIKGANSGARPIAVTTVSDGERFPISIITYPLDKKIHPTQKPVSLFEYLINTYTNEGEIVLDNCGGSGTTAIACVNTKRKYIVMEKEQEYFDISQKRVAEYKPWPSRA